MNRGLSVESPCLIGSNMGYFISCILLLASSVAQAAEDGSSFPKSQVFSLTPEEMVFASKLSDENRHKFCYTFSMQERVVTLQASKESSPNESVEKVIALSSEDFHLIPN